MNPRAPCAFLERAQIDTSAFAINAGDNAPRTAERAASRATIPTADEYGTLRAMEEEDARIQPGR
jgi:hypothetical protein